MLLSWSFTRKAEYLGGVLVVVALCASGFLWWILDQPPTCTDGKQNQNELGVDCGGICGLRCASETRRLLTKWVMPLEVSEGFWSVVAYVENPNLHSYVDTISYRFKLYDENNALVVERDGSTFIHGDPVVPIFEGGIDTQGKRVARAFVEFANEPVWYTQRIPIDLDIEQQSLAEESVRPRLTARVVNREFFEVRDTEVSALIFDTDDNIMAASETVVTRILSRGNAQVTFTWPRPFPRPVGRVEIVPRTPPMQKDANAAHPPTL